MEAHKTLRDDLAMAAMQGYLATNSSLMVQEFESKVNIAYQAYGWADAMLKAREVE
jgi:hypothetical protein